MHTTHADTQQGKQRPLRADGGCLLIVDTAGRPAAVVYVPRSASPEQVKRVTDAVGQGNVAAVPCLDMGSMSADDVLDALAQRGWLSNPEASTEYQEWLHGEVMEEGLLS